MNENSMDPQGLGSRNDCSSPCMASWVRQGFAFPNPLKWSTKMFLMYLVLLMSTSCYYDNEEELYQHVQNQACDTSDITYSGYIVPLLNQQCNACHSTAAASGGIVLDNYAGVSAAVASGKLWGSISWTGGVSPMPKGGNQLDACSQKKVKTWLNAGYPQN